MSSTVIRAVEAFVAVLIAAFFTQVTIDQRPLDLTSKDGQSRIIAAALAAVLIAIQQITATSGGNTSSAGPTPPTPTPPTG